MSRIAIPKAYGFLVGHVCKQIVTGNSIWVLLKIDKINK